MNIARFARFLPAAVLGLLPALSGCDSIGEGSTLEKLELVPASGVTQTVPYEEGGSYKLFQCFRDEFIAVGTFTSGTTANFNRRARWTSSDPSVVQVSNGDIPAVFVVGGDFIEHGTVRYARGTVIPRGVPGSKATITAEFVGLKASINVEIRKPALRIVPAPSSDPSAVVNPVHLAEGTIQRLTVLGDLDGRTVTLSDLAGGSFNGFSINPFRWRFTSGVFQARNENVPGDFDKWLVPDATNPVANINVSSGTVTGVKADFIPYEIATEPSLCVESANPDPALQPKVNAQVGRLVSLSLDREAQFNTAGTMASSPFNPQSLAIGTNQLLEVRGNLDTTDDGIVNVGAVQNLNSQARYNLEPKNAVCENEAKLLGCQANSDFVFSQNLLSTGTGAADNDTARGQACFPLCIPTLATLEADKTSGAAPLTVTFTAAALAPPAGVTVHYVFDFDGADGPLPPESPQAEPTATHSYSDAGQYTATVRIVDAAFPGDFLSQNAGAVRIVVNQAPSATAPTARLTASTAGGQAPVTVLLNASTSSDPDVDDSITVYEFDVDGNGSPDVRQTSPILAYTYLSGTGVAFTPSVLVYDKSGRVSAAASAPAITVTGTALAPLRSNALPFTARDVTLCSIAIQPSSAVEPAFTFPGAKFEAVGTFVPNVDPDNCNASPLGTQKVTRFMNWAARPAGSTTTFSNIAAVRTSSDDFQSVGQIRYFEDVTNPVTLDITATPSTQVPFKDVAAPSPATLTVQPCTGCTP